LTNKAFPLGLPLKVFGEQTCTEARYVVDDEGSAVRAETDDTRVIFEIGINLLQHAVELLQRYRVGKREVGSKPAVTEVHNHFIN
jgi:hypothetical protein